MALDPDAGAYDEQCRRELEAMTPEENIATAAFARRFAPTMPKPHQRRILEHLAQTFEERAAAQISGASG